MAICVVPSPFFPIFRIQMLQKLKLEIKNLATRALIFANGRQALIQPGVEGVVLNAASRGIPVVCLHHTGGAAEMFGNALTMRREGVGAFQKGHMAKNEKLATTKDWHGRYHLPDNIPDDSCLVLDSSSDSVEKVIDKLTLVLSSVQDDEMREVGNSVSEKERLMFAWDIIAKFICKRTLCSLYYRQYPLYLQQIAKITHHSIPFSRSCAESRPV